MGRTDIYWRLVSRLKRVKKPVYQKPRVMNPQVEAKVQKQVYEWLKHKIVLPSKSPWSNSVVPVVKKNGETRFCLDFRKLDQSIIRDKCAGNSAMDAAHAYFTILLEAGSREYIVFPTSNRLNF